MQTNTATEWNELRNATRERHRDREEGVHKGGRRAQRQGERKSYSGNGRGGKVFFRRRVVT